MRYVAIEDFHDHAGVLVERGDVFPENAEAVRRFPHYFDLLRAATRGGLITRVGGEARLVGSATPHPRRQIGVSRSRPRAGVTRSAETRPSWQIGPDPKDEPWRIQR